jgi:peptidoglycan hydrolase FlgJ
VEDAALDIVRFSQPAGTPRVPKGDAQKMDQAAKDFEAVFISQMFEAMWADVKTDGAFGGGSGEKIFRSLMIQDMGKQIAAQGGIGLADTVKREMIAMQERARQ